MPVTIRGVPELEASLRRAGSELGEMTRTHSRVSELVASAARPPRKSGRLAASVRADPKPDRASVSVGVPYGGMVEYGTRHMSARPYLRPAFESTRARWLDAYTQEVDDICDRVTT